MDIREMDNQNFADIFNTGTGGDDGQNQNRSFGGFEPIDDDMFKQTTKPPEDTTTTAAPLSETTTLDLKTAGDDADILGTEEEGNEGGSQAGAQTGKETEVAIEKFYKKAVKDGKFAVLTQEAEDGSEIEFIPKNFEELNEAIDTQVEHRMATERKTLEQAVYNSKTPAWQAVLKYSEMVESPEEVLPFIQGVKSIESVANLDENVIEQAEQIVRARLEQRGDSKELIDEQVEGLIASDKLLSTAKKMKPIIIQEEQKVLSEMVRRRKEDVQRYEQIVSGIREGAIKALEAPIFGKQKLKREEQSAIFDMIGEPDPSSNGYGIYNEIDSLFEKGDFETLKQLALLIKNKDSFLAYAGAQAAQKTAENLQKQLRVAGDKNKGGNALGSGESVNTINRNQYKKPGFNSFNK